MIGSKRCVSLTSHYLFLFFGKILRLLRLSGDGRHCSFLSGESFAWRRTTTKIAVGRQQLFSRVTGREFIYG
ncbi:hypothetical protein, partial [Stutzerimonas stutzeri]|uniref:hypothetical protein n=1 Tax=Stutzerimonas stutzeri TaxID=316 RepID=UPI00210D5D60